MQEKGRKENFLEKYTKVCGRHTRNFNNMIYFESILCCFKFRYLTGCDLDVLQVDQLRATTVPKPIQHVTRVGI
jgi:hypothetical protein